MSLEPRGALAVLDLLRRGGQLVPGLGHRDAVFLQQVLAVVERRSVGKQRQRHQLAVHRLRLDDRREVVRDHVGRGLAQVEEAVRELRRPDHVGLVDVDVGVARGQPQPVLRELVGGRGRHRHDGDGIAGLSLPRLDQVPHHVDVFAGCARHEVDVHRARGSSPHSRQSRPRNDSRFERQPVQKHSDFLPGLILCRRA